MKKCALLQCELEDDWETLKEVSQCKDVSKRVRKQARMLIKYYYKKSDKLCSTCFWK